MARTVVGVAANLSCGRRRKKKIFIHQSLVNLLSIRQGWRTSFGHSVGDESVVP